ncbi:hypothetical protein ATANTOWER_008700 [Ataeniobius toweri]|uniref:Uncharacterized protein n=1 Tax=Ataeniobius toweri TaxID=208326 RepID=A0ABU7B3J9_9TELE|nr:hypothetical protein [Ataeniobius toweri]
MWLYRLCRVQLAGSKAVAHQANQEVLRWEQGILRERRQIVSSDSTVIRPGSCSCDQCRVPISWLVSSISRIY